MFKDYRYTYFRKDQLFLLSIIMGNDCMDKNKKELFMNILKGGHPNSLGKTVEVVETVLTNPERFEELFQCYSSDDEVVRFRTSNAMKRICKERKELLIPHIDRILEELPEINQASAQWTLAQLSNMLDSDMAKSQLEKAKKLLKNNLVGSNDWIVLNLTMEVLAKWSKKDCKLLKWLTPYLKSLSRDERKSVSKRAQKYLRALNS